MKFVGKQLDLEGRGSTKQLAFVTHRCDLDAEKLRWHWQKEDALFPFHACRPYHLPCRFARDEPEWTESSCAGLSHVSPRGAGEGRPALKLARAANALADLIANRPRLAPLAPSLS